MKGIVYMISSAVDFLLENADAPIRYRVFRELLEDAKAAKAMESELLDCAAVGLWLRNLTPETPPQHWSMEHGSFDFCLENALLKTVQLGLQSELPQLTGAVSYYANKLEADTPAEGYRNNTGFRLGSANLGFYSIIIANCLTLAGIKNETVRNYMTGGLDELNDFVSKRDYDIYVNGEERNELKSVPAIWKDKKFIKRGITDEYGFCYPLIYDIVGFYGLYGTLDAKTDKKIDAVVDYISTDEFHDKISDGYGILISGDKKYHAMGWDPKYPGWYDAAGYMENGNAAKLLFFAQYIVKFPIARKTKWFEDLLAYLERYKTAGDTYVFPAGWLKETRGYAVQGSHISFGENRKKKNWREIESTFYMQMLKNVIIRI